MMEECFKKKHNQDKCATDISRCLIYAEGNDGGRVFSTIERQQYFYMPDVIPVTKTLTHMPITMI